MHDDFAAGFAQYLPQAFVQLELLRGQVRSGNLCFPRIDFFGISGFHKVSLFVPQQFKAI
jgi:hypothetical protein